MREDPFRLHKHTQVAVIVQHLHGFQQGVGRVLLAPQNLQPMWAVTHRQGAVLRMLKNPLMNGPRETAQKEKSWLQREWASVLQRVGWVDHLGPPAPWMGDRVE